MCLMYHSCNLYSIILSFISAMALAVVELEWLMTLSFLVTQLMQHV